MPQHEKNQDVLGVMNVDLWKNIPTSPSPQSEEFMRKKMSHATLMDAWKDVKSEEFTKDDWLDLHATIEAFKARVVQRHRPSTRLEGERPHE